MLQEQAITVYYATGFTRNQIVDLCGLILRALLETPDQLRVVAGRSIARAVLGPVSNKPLPLDPHPNQTRRRKQKFGLYAKIVIVSTYLYRNRTEWDLAEQYDVDQSTIPRIVADYTPVLNTVLAQYVPTVDDLDPTVQLIVDGTLLPCWSWADHHEDYSGNTT
ncbi:MAG: hypothetical protein LBK59_01280 [Bifidobacteriaceae bacterium]|jgi:hypothetical protein|nr:hypothetical protein [Bifidobacteriaceae bacterium]